MPPPDASGDDHPIINKAVGLLEVEDQHYILNDRGMAELGRDLEALLSSWELPLAVDSLLRLAHVLEAEWSSPQAAYALCELIEQDAVLDGLKLLAQEAREQIEAAGGDPEPFQKFIGAGPSSHPLRVGETPPEGAVKLDAFKAPRRV